MTCTIVMNPLVMTQTFFSKIKGGDGAEEYHEFFLSPKSQLFFLSPKSQFFLSPKSRNDAVDKARPSFGPIGNDIYLFIDCNRCSEVTHLVC